MFARSLLGKLDNGVQQIIRGLQRPSSSVRAKVMLLEKSQREAQGTEGEEFWTIIGANIQQ